MLGLKQLLGRGITGRDVPENVSLRRRIPFLQLAAGGGRAQNGLPVEGVLQTQVQEGRVIALIGAAAEAAFRSKERTLSFLSSLLLREGV
jgi:hypothetical protein